MICFRCLNVIDGGVNKLFTHLKYIHNVQCGTSTYITCRQEGCLKTFTHVSSYKRHIILKHSHDQADANLDLHEDDVGGSQFNYPADNDQPDDLESDDESPSMNKDDILEAASFFIADLKASSVPYSSIQKVIDETEELVQAIVGHLRKKLVSVVNQIKGDGLLRETDSARFDALLMEFDSLRQPFEGLRTPSQQDSFFKSKGVLISPQEISIGRSFVSQSDTSTGGVKQRLKRDTFQYVPMAKTIAKHLEQPGVMTSILEQQPSQDECLLKTYRDGSYFRGHCAKAGEVVIPVLLYSDDYETGNPLGSKKGVHKLTAFYISLVCLPAKFQSSLNNILLAACSERSVVAEYGIDKVLSVMVNDFKEMEREGIQIACDSYTGIVRPILFQVIGDNLGLHELLGFVGSFSANYACRFCKAPKDVLHVQVVEDLSLLRDKQNFDEDLVMNDVSKTGVKRNSELNQLESFHVCQNYTPDVMHDFLEGIIPLEFNLVIGLLIQEGCFSLQELNDRISSFSYGFVDKKNKPSPIKPSALMNPSSPSGQKAAQMSCLARYFPLIIGDLVDDSCDVWELFLMLMDIYKIVMSPYISRAGIHMLRALIRDHHQLFLELFEDRHLIPKQHFLVHYPRLIEVLGPIVQYSSIRKEGKHKPFKRWARACNNFKNIAKTVAERHQRQQSYVFLLRKPQSCDMEIQEQLPSLVSSLEGAQEMCLTLGCTQDDTVTMSESIRIQSYEFKPNCMIISDWDDKGPQFAQVKHIVINDRDVYFVACLWETSFYNRQKHAYAVTECKTHIIIQPQDLFLCRPLHVTKCYSKTDLCWYIVAPVNIV
ncbi:uncharacterized protein [Asterias amurensis]|uniref:uncharacterized protein n=1 Tax=Asterias amurensis TaxID=7602 RepID=UPI003AB443F0